MLEALARLQLKTLQNFVLLDEAPRLTVFRPGDDGMVFTRWTTGTAAMRLLLFMWRFSPDQLTRLGGV